MIQTLTLKNARFAAETTAHGAELISFKDSNGTEYIWSGDPAFWTGRNPVLFPIVGNLKNGRVLIKDKVYEMNRHGFARTQDFVVKEQSEDSVTYRLSENEETLSRYPYPFIFEVRHALTETGFSTTFTVENPGEEILPFCVGAHTAFNCPVPGEGVDFFSDYELIFEKTETKENLLLTSEGIFHPTARGTLLTDSDRLALDYKIFGEIDTIVYDGLQSTAVTLKSKTTGRGVRMDFPDFPMIAFWTKPGAPYICLEPWHGCAASEDETGRFEDKPHCICLEPGKRMSLSFHVTPLLP